LGALVIAGVSFGIYKFRCEPKSQPLIPAQNISTTKTSDETSNWKTYESKEAKFSIKYPPTFSAMDKPTFNPTGSSEFKIWSDNYKEIPLKDALIPQRGGYVFINSNNFVFEGNIDRFSEYVNFEINHFGFNANGSIEPESTIDGQKAAKFIYKGPSEVGLLEGQTLERALVVNKDGVPYKIDLIYFTQETDLARTLNKILSTFKFL
jgi:hypothetical protein